MSSQHRITEPGQLDELPAEEIRRRCAALIKAKTRDWPPESRERIYDLVPEAALEIRKAFKTNPTLDGRNVGFAEFFAARLFTTLRKRDQKDHPEFYDEKGRYARRELLARDADELDQHGKPPSPLGSQKSSDDSRDHLQSRLDRGETEDRGGEDRKDRDSEMLHDASDETWFLNVSSKGRRRSKKRPDPTGRQAIRNLNDEARRQVGPIPIGKNLDRLVYRMLRASMVPASVNGIIRLTRRIWDNGAEPISGRQAAKELGHEDYKTKPATGPSIEIAEELHEQIELGYLEEPPAFKSEPDAEKIL
jgi:hypothetical protein